MLKRSLLMLGFLAFLNGSALASVDAIVLGSEDLDDMGSQEGPPALKSQSNELDLYSSEQQPTDAGASGDPTYSPAASGQSDVGSLPNDDNAPVPEPATGVLLGVGVLGLARMLRRKPVATEAE